MLYGLGLMILLLSTAFVGGSAAVPVTMVVVGVSLMILGRRSGDGKKTRI